MAKLIYQNKHGKQNILACGFFVLTLLFFIMTAPMAKAILIEEEDPAPGQSQISDPQEEEPAQKSEPKSEQEGFKVTEIFSIEGQKTSSSITEAAKQKGISPVAEIVLRAIDMLSRVIAVFAFLGLIVSGLILITSHGNEQQITKGKTVMVYSFIGLIVTLLAFLLITSIQALFL